MRLVADNVDFEQYLTRFVDAERVARPSSFEEKVIDRIYGDAHTNAPTLPWQKTHNLFRMRDGETTIWGGINGHGKSLITTQIGWGLVMQGKKICIASFEMPPESTLVRLLRMASGGPFPTREFIRDFLHWTDDKLYILAHEGKCQRKQLVGAMRFVANEYGCQHFFLDNLTKVATEEDYRGQQDFIDEVTTIGKDNKMHCHIVAHVRKGQSEYDLPDKFDIKGSGSIVDQVDNAIIVWRNKKKEDKLKLPTLEQAEKDKLKATPDCLLLLNKQRHGEWEGKLTLWIHQQSMSFVESATGTHSSFHVPTFNPNPVKEVTLEW